MGGLTKFRAATREPLVKDRRLAFLVIFRRLIVVSFRGEFHPIIQIFLVVSVFTDTDPYLVSVFSIAAGTSVTAGFVLAGSGFGISIPSSSPLF